jgi:hypothetical protein
MTAAVVSSPLVMYLACHIQQSEIMREYVAAPREYKRELRGKAQCVVFIESHHVRTVNIMKHMDGRGLLLFSGH